MIVKVAEAIMNQYRQDTTLSNSLTGGLYFRQVPDDATAPYATFMCIGSVSEDFLGATATENRMETTSFQFTVFSDSYDGGEKILSVLNDLKNCFDFCELTIDGYYNVVMRREATGPIMFAEEMWQGNIDYEIKYVKE